MCISQHTPHISCGNFHSINPKQLDRFRDRLSPAGARDARRDARRVLVDCSWNRLSRRPSTATRQPPAKRGGSMDSFHAGKSTSVPCVMSLYRSRTAIPLEPPMFAQYPVQELPTREKSLAPAYRPPLSAAAGADRLWRPSSCGSGRVSMRTSRGTAFRWRIGCASNWSRFAATTERPPRRPPPRTNAAIAPHVRSPRPPRARVCSSGQRRIRAAPPLPKPRPAPSGRSF